MANDLICPICGEPTFLVYGKYPRKDGLCKECSQKLFNKEIEQCSDCGKFHNAEEACPCKKPASPTVVKELPKENSASDLTCIICGEDSNGKHFCYNCYSKYKDRSIDIRISNCRDTQVIDEYGNKSKKTKDGRSVRSLSEKIIIDYFFDNFIRVVYEKTVPYTNEKSEHATLHPDFYLPDYNLYIEFNGLTNKSYLKQKN